MNYLRRIKLYNGGKDVKAKKIVDGHFGVYHSKDQIDDLGDSIDMLPISVGVKAIQFKSPPVESFDPESETFKEIATNALKKNSGCQAGPRFLVFERSTKTFYELFCGNKSEQRVAPSIISYLPVTQEMIDGGMTKEKEVRDMPKPFTLKSQLAENNEGTWFAPNVEDCLTPFDGLFTRDELQEAIALFENTGDGSEEVKEEEAPKRRSR